MNTAEKATPMEAPQTQSPADAAARVRQALPKEGLFAGHEWRISPAPFRVGPELAAELEQLGRVLLQFYQAVNLLYRKSAEGKQPEWVAHWLDQGKPAELIQLQRSPVRLGRCLRTIYRVSSVPTCS